MGSAKLARFNGDLRMTGIEDPKIVTRYRFRCVNCQTTVEVFEPFRRKPCPLCGEKMHIVGVKSGLESDKKGGETECRSEPSPEKKDGA